MKCKGDYVNDVKIIMLRLMVLLWVVKGKEGFILLINWQL
jgi:hypothetical protein